MLFIHAGATCEHSFHIWKCNKKHSSLKIIKKKNMSDPRSLQADTRHMIAKH